MMMAASAAALVHAGAIPAFAQNTRTLKMGYVPSQNPQIDAAARIFGEEVAKRTDGRYRVESLPSNSLMSEPEVIRNIQRGKVDVGFITSAPLSNIVLEVGVFGIPFIFEDANHARGVIDGPVGLACLEKFRDANLVGLAWGENGMRQITNSKRPIRTPDDFKGLKLVLPQSAVMMIGLEAVGADVSVLPFAELFEALRLGRFDGQDNPIATAQAANLWQVQKYLTLTNHVYDPAVILMSPSVYDGLQERDQVALKEAAKFAGLASRRSADEAQATGIEIMRQAGLQVISAIDRATFVSAMAPARKKYDELFTPGLVGWISNAS
jgi:tripartite ATP-independent transporter DctP family solute receptor